MSEKIIKNKLYIKIAIDKMWWLYVLFRNLPWVCRKSDISCFYPLASRFATIICFLYLIKHNLTLNIDSSIVTYSARSIKYWCLWMNTHSKLFARILFLAKLSKYAFKKNQYLIPRANRVLYNSKWGKEGKNQVFFFFHCEDSITTFKVFLFL